MRQSASSVQIKHVMLLVAALREGGFRPARRRRRCALKSI